MNNRTIAELLTAHAHRLEERHRSLYRIRAYRRAAETILGLDRPLTEIVAESGRKELQALPGIGRRLSRSIVRLLATGEFHTPSGQPALPFHAVLSDATAHGS